MSMDVFISAFRISAGIPSGHGALPLFNKLMALAISSRDGGPVSICSSDCAAEMSCLIVGSR